MRKHSVRKWIHAILDMLPLVVIPIFAIYSHRHQIVTYTVVRDETLVGNAFQGVINGSPLTDEHWSQEHNSISYEDTLHAMYIDMYGETSLDIDFNAIENDVVFLKYSYSTNSFNTTTKVYLFGSDDDAYFYDNNNVTLFTGTAENFVSSFTTLTLPYDCGDITQLIFDISETDVLYLKNIMLFNLTSIFGTGNEPSGSVFNTYLINDYYDFGDNLIEVGSHQVTYNDTDIGSQFVYQLYNVTDKYFNFNKVGTFEAIYNWFEINLFGGSSPMSFFIVWNIILYEFIMDLIFLTYMLFMFIIDFAEHLIDCFFDKSYRGGR